MTLNKKKEKLLSEQTKLLRNKKEKINQTKNRKNKYSKENNLLSQTTAITNKQHLEIRIKIAKTYTKKGFTSKAFDELKRLKNEHPGYMPGRIAMGLLFYGNGNIIEAQSEWQNVLSRDPSHPEAQMYLQLSRGATETTINF
jgi:Tfp pilus assembly protein PilF